MSELMKHAPEPWSVSALGNGIHAGAQLEHPRGGPLTCVKNRTGKIASDIVKRDGKWFWALPTADQQKRDDRG